MSARGGAPLYTPAVLALAVDLAAYPLTPELAARGEAHSRACGSRIAVGFALDAAGRVVQAGARVTACAIGQAAASLFLAGVRGRGAADIAAAAEGIARWLGEENVPPPVWPGVSVLAPARAHPGRHGAILLPWRAGLDALSNTRLAA